MNSTTAVGSYPEGASPYGALNMAGNVWEWTSSLYRAYPYRADDGREDLNVEGARVVRGGAFLSPRGDIRCAHRLKYNPDTPPYPLGFQVAFTQTTYVYVPAGEFVMGSAEDDSDAESDEKPQHTVYLDAFWIMQTEVTNAMYGRCSRRGPASRQAALDLTAVTAITGTLSTTTIRRSTSPGMTRRNTAPGRGGGCPRRRSGRRLPAAQMDASTPGAMEQSPAIC